MKKKRDLLRLEYTKFWFFVFTNSKIKFIFIKYLFDLLRKRIFKKL